MPSFLVRDRQRFDASLVEDDEAVTGEAHRADAGAIDALSLFIDELGDHRKVVAAVQPDARATAIAPRQPVTPARPRATQRFGITGTLGEIRTPDTRFRRPRGR
jgi:hypothetical protein